MSLSTAAVSRRKHASVLTLHERVCAQEHHKRDILFTEFLLLLFIGSSVKMANSNRRVSCGLDFCSIPDIRGSLQGASEAGYARFLFIIFFFLLVFLLLVLIFLLHFHLFTSVYDFLRWNHYPVVHI
jgi:hypothetical protein